MFRINVGKTDLAVSLHGKAPRIKRKTLVCCLLAAMQMYDASADAEKQEYFYIDPQVQDFQHLLDMLPSEASVLVLDPKRNGFTQIADHLAGRSGIDAIHLISHGKNGRIQAGDIWLSGANVLDNQESLVRIGSALGDSGDFLIYGCEVASGPSGISLIKQLASLTGADIAASDNLTGGASKGGDWVLEASIGAIESNTTLVDASYQHVLYTLNAGDIVVLGWSALNDTVTFATLVDIPAGTVIKITEFGWNQATNSFATGTTADGTISWTTSSSISAGNIFTLFFGGSDQTEVLTNITTSTNLSADLARDGSGWTLAADPMNTAGDGVFIYQDSAANPYFIFGLNNSAGVVDGTNWNTSVAVAARDSMIPNGSGSQNALTNGTNAIGLPGGGSQNDNVQYTGATTSADRDTWLARITNSSNWSGDNVGTVTTSVGTIGGSALTVSLPAPTITSATYDANAGTLVVTGTGFSATGGATNDVIANKFTLTAEGGGTYTLTDTANVEITSATSFTLTLSATDRAAVNQTLNKNGTSSTGGTTYNLAGAAGFIAASAAVADTTGNGITVSNVAVPTITSATYDANTGALVVTGSGLLKLSGATNDIVANKFTLTGEGGSTYTLTDTANVEITSGTSLTLTLSATDRAGVNLNLNKNGTSSTGGTTYNLAAAEDWAAGANAAVTVADVTGNGITVSNVAVPTVTSATYDASTGVLAVTGTGLLKLSGSNNDIVANKFTFTGEAGGTYTLTDTANVEVTSGTAFTLTLSATDNSGVNLLLNKNGTSSTGGTIYNFAAAEDWAAGADAAVVVADTTGNGITVSNVAVNSTPAMSGLNGDSVAWAGEGSTVALDAGGNSDLDDADFEALNSGNGNWSGGSLTVQRNGTAVSADVFGFDTSGALFTVSGGNLQSGGQTFATFTNTNGVLTVSFTSSGTNATTALVNNVAQRITYRNDTPAGNATIRFTVSDGAASTTADVTVASDTIYVTNTSDVSTIDASNGVGLREAVAIAYADLTGTQTIVFSSALASSTITLGSTLSVRESFTLDADAASGLTITGSAIDFNGGSLVTSFTNGSGDTATISSVISNTGSINKSGAGTLTLSGSNTFSGITTVSAGTLSVASDSNIGSGTVSLGSGAVLAVTGATNIDNALTLAGDATVDNSAAVTLSGVISGANNFAKSGAGTLTLSANNTYSGSTTVSAGTLSVAGDGNLGSGALSLSGGGLSVTGATTIDNSISLTGSAGVTNANAVTLSGVIGGTGNLAKSGAGTLTLSGNNTYTGTTSVGAGTLSFSSDGNLGGGSLSLSAGSTLSVTGATTVDNAIALAGDATVNNSAAVTLAGVISGGFGFAKTGASDLTLSGTNTYTGTTTVSAGTLSVAGDGNLGGGALTLAAGTTVVVTGSTTIDNAIALAGSATLNNSNDVSLSGVVSGANGLAKTGIGTLTLSATNTYTGTTTVSAGSLAITGATAGATTVASGASLTGSGTLGGAVTIQNGGTLSPGTSPGTLTIDGDLTMASGSTLVVEVNGTTAGTDYDRLIVNGTADVTGATLSVTHGYVPGNGDTYTIVSNDAADAISGTFNGISEGSTVAAGGNGTVLTASYVGGSGNDFTLTAPSNTPPVVGGLHTDGVTFSQGNGGVLLDKDADATVTDGDSADFNNGTVVVSIIANGAVGEDVLSINNQGTGAGQIGVSGSDVSYEGTVIGSFSGGSGGTNLEIEMNSNANAAAAQALVRNLVYQNTNATNGISQLTRTVRITLSDGDGGTSSNADVTVAVVETVVPTASVVVADTALSAGETSTVTITFSEAVSGLTTGDFTVANGGLSNLASSDGGVTWTATLTPSASVEDASNIITLDNTGYADLVGNAGSGTTDSNNYAIDTLRPSATLVVTDTALAAGETSLITITFNEAVTGFTNADLTVANGTLSAVSSSDGGVTWTATFTPTASVQDPTNVITLDNTGVADAAGNAGSGTTDSNNYALDTARPTATLVVATTQLISGQTSPLTITFSEAVSGLTTADFIVDNGALSGLSSGDGGVTWTATLTPDTSVDDATNVVTLDNTGVADAAGNTGTGTTTSNNYVIDSAAPNVTSVSVPSNDTYVAGETLTFTVNTSENVTVNTTGGTPYLSLTIGSTARTASYVSGPPSSALEFSYTVLSGDGDSDGISVGTLSSNGGTLKDAAGNDLVLTLNSVGSTAGVLVDAVVPTLVSLSPADNSPTVAPGDNLVVTLSENIAIGTGNITIYDSNGTPFTTVDVANAAGQVAVSGAALTLNPTSNLVEGTDYYVQIANTAITDLAGNAFTGISDTSSWSFTVADISPPAVTGIAVSGTPAANASTIQFTVTFDEPPQNVTVGDFSLTPGAVGVSGSVASVSPVNGNTVTVTVDQISGTGTLRLDLNANSGVTDAAGNGNGTNGYVAAFTGGATHTVDRDPPAAPSTPDLTADSDTGSSSTDNITNDTTPTLTGTAAANATISISSSLSGTLGTAAADGAGIWSFTPGAAISAGVHVVTATATDAAGNSSSPSASLSVTVDTTVPVVTASAPDSGALSRDINVPFQMTFSENVDGLSADDFTLTPSGSASGTVGSVSAASGTSVTVVVTGISGNGSLRLDTTGSGIADLAGNLVPAFTAGTAHVLDTAAPTVTDGRISLSGATGTGGAFKVGDTVTATWNNTAGGDNNSDVASVTANFSQFGGGNAVSAVNSGGTWTASFTLTAAALDATNRNLSITATDTAGNSSTTADTTNASVDSQLPMVSDTNISLSGATGNGGVFKAGDIVVATWNNTAAGDNNADIVGATVNFSAFGGGTAVAAINNAGTWTASYALGSGLDSGNLNISLSATDDAGNTGTVADTSNGTVDTVVPAGHSVTFSDTIYSAAEAGSAGFSFSAAEVGASYSYTISSSGGGTPVTGTGTVSSATQSVTGVSLSGLMDGTLTLSVVLTDSIGNAATAVTASAALDANAPTGQSVVFTDSTLGAAEAGTAGFSFAGAEVGATYSYSISSSGGGTPVTGAGTVATGTDMVSGIDLSGLPDGTLTLSVVITDTAGNAAPAITASASLDQTAPTAAISAVSGPVNGPFTATVTFSEAVSGFVIADITAGNATLSSLVNNGGGSYSVTVTPTADGNVTLDVAANIAEDVVGNNNSAATQLNVAYDGSAPTPAITTLASSPTNAAFVANISFGEVVSGFAIGDITAGNATLSNLMDNGGGSYSVTVTPIADGNVTLDIAAGAAEDGAGNASLVATQLSLVYDSAIPAPTITSAEPDPTNSASFPVSIAFGEVVSGFTIGDITLVNATLSGFADNGGGNYSVTVSPSSDGTVSLNLAAGVAEDAAGNANLAVGFSRLHDGTAPALMSSLPADGATNVAFNSNVVLTFSEAVFAGTGSLTLYDAADDSVVEAFVVSSGLISNNVVILDPAANLAPNHSYYLQIAGTALVDAAGNTYAGINDKTTFNFTVTNVAPVAATDSATVAEDNAVAINVLANDADADSNLNAASVTVVTAPLHGSTSVNTGTGVITYTAAVNYNGSDSFTYTVQDVFGAASNVGMVNLTVTPVNDAPVAVADLASTPEDNSVSIDVAANDTDIDMADATPDTLDTASITIVGGPANGTVQVLGGEVLYTPVTNFNGSDGFSYTIQDAAGATSNVATVIVNVTGVNDLPVAADESTLAYEDTMIGVDVLANDGDGDGTLDATSVQVLAAPQHGTTDVDPLTGMIYYTPNLNFHGSDSFTYVVRDNDGGTSNAATVSINVVSVNDAPVANADVAVLQEDSDLNINVLGNDTDVDGTLSPASVQVVTAAQQGTTSVNPATGAIGYTPGNNFNGSDSFTYRVRDNDGVWSAPATVTITVQAVNDEPLANSDAATTDEDTAVILDLLGNDGDVDGTLDPASLALTQPAAGTLTDNGDGTVTYTPAANVFGVDSFTYTVSDTAGGVSNTASVTVTVNPVNDAPVISGTPGSSVSQDSSYSFTPTASDVDPNTTLTFSITNRPEWASFNTATGALTGTPGNEDVGDYDGIVIGVSDGSLTANLPAFNIQVVDVNDAPVISGMPITSINQDGSYSFVPNVVDVDANASLTFSVSNLPQWARFNPVTGAITGTPSNSDVGTYNNIVISVSDGVTTTMLASFSITVANVNDPPVIVADSYNLNEGGVLQRNAANGVMANDFDIDGDNLAAVLMEGPRNASEFSFAADGSFRYVHNGSETRSDSFTYRLTDNLVSSGPVTVRLNISPINDPPAFITTPGLTVTEGAVYAYDVGVRDPDSAAELTLLEGPAWLTLTGGRLSGAAPLNQLGPVQAVLRAGDGEYTVDQTFQLTVLAQEAAVVTLSPAWQGVPAIVDGALDLRITAAQSRGPALPNATLQVTLQGLAATTSMANCTAGANNTFTCATSLSVGTDRVFRAQITPQEAGNLVVLLRLNANGGQVASTITDVSVSPKAVSQGNTTFRLANATSLATINLLNDGTRELVAGTTLGETVKFLNYVPSANTAEVVREIENRGYTDRVRVVDVDQDGLEDVVVANRSGAASAVYYDRGEEFLPEPGSLPLPHAREALLRDLNDDGFPELILGANGFNLYIYENNEGVYDVPPLVFTSSDAIAHFALLRRLPEDAPFEGTLVISGRDTVRLVRFGLEPDASKPGEGEGSAGVSEKFTQLQQLPLAGVSAVQLADIDGDGREEIIASTVHQNNLAETSGVTVIRVNEDEQLEPVVRLGAASANNVEVADFNGDGVPDLLVANANNSYQFYRGTADPATWTLTDTILYHSSTLVVPEDVNNDGLADVLIYEDSDEQVELYLSAPDGELGLTTNLVVSATTRAVRDDRYHFEYELTVNNRGDNPANNIRVTLPLVAGIGVVELPDLCQYDELADRVTCDLEDLAPGNGRIFSLILAGDGRINSLSLTAQVTSDAGETNVVDNTVTTPLSGMFEYKRARIKGGGGSVGYLWLAALLGLELGRRRSRRSRSTKDLTVPTAKEDAAMTDRAGSPEMDDHSRPARLVAGLLPALTALGLAATYAPETVAREVPRNSYLEGTLGLISSDWDMLNFYYDLSGSTQEGVLVEKDDQRAGWQLLYGYRAHRNLAIEVGYLDSGQTELEVETVISDPEPLRQVLMDHAPVAGEGPYVGLRLSHYSRSDQELYLKAGLWSWSAGYTLSIGDRTEWVKRSDESWLVGVGFSVPLMERLSLGGSLQTTTMEDDRLMFTGLHLSYRFHVGR